MSSHILDVQHYNEKNDGDETIVLLKIEFADPLFCLGRVKPTQKHFVEEARTTLYYTQLNRHRMYYRKAGT